MSRAHSAALRKQWSDPAYRAKQAKSREKAGAIDELTEQIVRWHDVDGLTWQAIAARTHMCVASVRRRYDRVKMAALEAENQALQRQAGELAQTLALTEESVDKLRAAWKHLCDCTDEFGADLGACAEWQDAVDGAIRNVIGESK